MTSEGTDVPVLSDRELAQVLGRAREEGWRELALVSESFDEATEDLLREAWPVDRIFLVKNLSTNRVREVATISTLTSLDLSANQIGDDGARSIASLTNLMALGLSNNRIGDEGARALGSLMNLTSLSLSGNRVGDEGAHALSSLARLAVLNLSGNRVGKEGAHALGSLTRLAALHLGANGMKDVGAHALGSLTELTFLDLRSNQIGDDGARALALLTKLTTLRLDRNQVCDEGACALGSLTTLTALYLNENRIGDQGVRALVALTSLTDLSLASNQIGDEGANALGSLTNLTGLCLAGNRIGDEGARALGSLTKLEYLDLAGNQIGDEGARAVSSLTGLTTLYLHENQIGVEGARALRSLVRLTDLTLDDNQIGDEGARALGSLMNLTSLCLSGNGIGDEGARPLGSLTRLTGLSLHSNRVGNDGARALGSLMGLKRLYLSDNKIGNEGARALSSLAGLIDLDLASNAIAESRMFSLMPSLATLRLHKNPITDAPPFLFEHAPWEGCLPALRAYWDDLARGAVLNRAVKVLLVGNGCVGKTTLAHCLKNGEAPKVPVSERTHGIELQSVELSLRDGPIDVRLWDFGGQERYHTMHRLFLRYGAFFLLLWAEETNESPDEERHPVSYWLDMIRHLTDDAKVLLVKNKIDLYDELKLPPGVEESALVGRPQVKTSAATCRGVERLKRLLSGLIQKARPKWQYHMPKSWQQVRADLDHLRRPELKAGDEPSRQTISLGHFEQICAKHGVGHGSVLLRFLHDTGEVFYRGGQFGDSVILDQNWFIDKLYHLFDQRGDAYALARRLGGELKGSDFKHFWPGEGAEWETYFDFMLQTRMAFELDRNYGKPFGARTMVLPAFLPTDDDMRLRSQLRHWGEVLPGEGWLRLGYPFLHRALIERIVVELNELSEWRLWWRDGLEISDPVTDCLVLLTASLPAGRLELRLRGGRQVDAFARVGNALKKILERDPEHTFVSNDGKTFVGLAKLDEAIRVEARLIATTAGCYVPRAPYDRFRLFAHPPKQEGDLMPQKESTPRSKRIFISWSREEPDQASLTELETRLKVLSRQFSIDFWHGGHIMAGAVVADEIYKRLEVADIVLLLISPEFMASDECYSSEMALALKKYEEERGAAVPLLLRPTDGLDALPIGRYQALPKNGRPISVWPDRDEAWLDVSRGLRVLLEGV